MYDMIYYSKFSLNFIWIYTIYIVLPYRCIACKIIKGLWTMVYSMIIDFWIRCCIVSKSTTPQCITNTVGFLRMIHTICSYALCGFYFLFKLFCHMVRIIFQIHNNRNFSFIWFQIYYDDTFSFFLYSLLESITLNQIKTEKTK